MNLLSSSLFGTGKRPSEMRRLPAVQLFLTGPLQKNSLIKISTAGDLIVSRKYRALSSLKIQKSHVYQPRQRHLWCRYDQIRRTSHPSSRWKSFRTWGPLVVVAPTTHDGIDLLYQLLSGHRCATACEPTNLLLEVVDRFLSGIGIERSPSGTRLDLACRQVHGPAPSLDLVRGKAISGSSDGFYHLLLGRIGG